MLIPSSSSYNFSSLAICSCVKPLEVALCSHSSNKDSSFTKDTILAAAVLAARWSICKSIWSALGEAAGAGREREKAETHLGCAPAGTPPGQGRRPHLSHLLSKAIYRYPIAPRDICSHAFCVFWLFVCCCWRPFENTNHPDKKRHPSTEHLSRERSNVRGKRRHIPYL